MRPAALDIVRRFFAEPRPARLRRDLVAALASGLAVTPAEAEGVVDQLVADDFLRAMRVHWYDREVERVVQADGVRPAVQLDRDLGSGRWPSPVRG